MGTLIIAVALSLSLIGLNEHWEHKYKECQKKKYITIYIKDKHKPVGGINNDEEVKIYRCSDND